MLFKKFILSVFLFLSISTVGSFSFASNQDTSVKGKETQLTCLNSSDHDGYDLVYMDGGWWWVLYDSDGSIIHKIPYDFD